MRSWPSQGYSFYRDNKGSRDLLYQIAIEDENGREQCMLSSASSARPHAWFAAAACFRANQRYRGDPTFRKSKLNHTQEWNSRKWLAFAMGHCKNIGACRLSVSALLPKADMSFAQILDQWPFGCFR